MDLIPWSSAVFKISKMGPPANCCCKVPNSTKNSKSATFLAGGTTGPLNGAKYHKVPNIPNLLLPWQAGGTTGPLAGPLVQSTKMYIPNLLLPWQAGGSTGPLAGPLVPLIKDRPWPHCSPARPTLPPLLLSSFHSSVYSLYSLPYTLNASPCMLKIYTLHTVHRAHIGHSCALAPCTQRTF